MYWWLRQNVDNCVAQVQPCLLCTRPVRLSYSLKRRVSATVSVLAQALQVTVLMLVEKLQLVFAGFENDPFELKCSLQALIVSCFELTDVFFVLRVDFGGVSISRCRQLANLVNQIEDHCDPGSYNRRAVCACAVTQDGFPNVFP
ncbi:hypothetical protein CJO88_08170 [Ralstonia solanacearum]|nr:hypothetical protein CJO83_08130 [Ralstonia solanacearum]AXW33324.1 hypothetical protein CJO88_08170 [Ralstonia solanacearum]AXW43021.1 hypothetical protein CJO90_08125 [Ralstonia solanacearum]AXW66344.1 hypothetical protein CJO95_08130 [Ralstonia solanacearum]